MNNCIPFPDPAKVPMPPRPEMHKFEISIRGPGMPAGPVMAIEAPNVMTALLAFAAQVAGTGTDPRQIQELIIKRVDSGLVTV